MAAKLVTKAYESSQPCGRYFSGRCYLVSIALKLTSWPYRGLDLGVGMSSKLVPSVVGRQISYTKLVWRWKCGRSSRYSRMKCERYRCNWLPVGGASNPGPSGNGGRSAQALQGVVSLLGVQQTITSHLFSSPVHSLLHIVHPSSLGLTIAVVSSEHFASKSNCFLIHPSIVPVQASNISSRLKEENPIQPHRIPSIAIYFQGTHRAFRSKPPG